MLKTPFDNKLLESLEDLMKENLDSFHKAVKAVPPGQRKLLMSALEHANKGDLQGVKEILKTILGKNAD